jgi:hypothetical protein
MSKAQAAKASARPQAAAGGKKPTAKKPAKAASKK